MIVGHKQRHVKHGSRHSKRNRWRACGGGGAATVDEEEAREAVFHRLENLGYRVGLGGVERFSREAPRSTAPLDCIKFICKDLWMLLFGKQIDNLKTNHRGIYVLTDNTFKPLGRMSCDTKKYDATMQAALVAQTDDVALGRDANSQARVQPFLYFPADLIRGCLASLGIQATVTAESAGRSYVPDPDCGGEELREWARRYTICFSAALCGVEGSYQVDVLEWLWDYFRRITT
ncbi:hypothetical protein COCVIDRAFT_20527 [Bipolaris victoriae FI3]|uniref:Trafficking protein particle complex subunit 6B n=1 Tax=Bipolaris victoriae (strain FI3) TaxID=930091 RepID=W7E3B9_BIPV3|nr:hypothetical protein COCVIDRAFT_20527 [Bipolaris victoriae FI3]